jgi:hypothetical protein
MCIMPIGRETSLLVYRIATAGIPVDHYQAGSARSKGAIKYAKPEVAPLLNKLSPRLDAELVTSLTGEAAPTICC